MKKLNYSHDTIYAVLLLRRYYLNVTPFALHQLNCIFYYHAKNIVKKYKSTAKT